MLGIPIIAFAIYQVWMMATEEPAVEPDEVWFRGQ